MTLSARSIAVLPLAFFTAIAAAQFQPQVTVVIHAAPHLPDLPELTAAPADVQRCVDTTCEKLLEPCGVFHSRTGSEIVLSNFHPMPWRAAGNVGARLPGDPISFVNRLNIGLSERAPRYVHILDVASLAVTSRRRGLDRSLTVALGPGECRPVRDLRPCRQPHRPSHG